MSGSLPQKTLGDHLHVVAKTALSTIPTVGGPIAELFGAVIAPPIERRRNDWLNGLASRLEELEQTNRFKIKDLANNEEFVTAVMHATTIAVRNHQSEKLEALRNAVLNCALGQYPSDVKRAMFLALVDEFTVWHLLILRYLSATDGGQRPRNWPITHVGDIVRVVMERVEPLRGEQALVELVVQDLCRKGLVFCGRDNVTTFVPTGTTQVTSLGSEFLKFISEPSEL